MIPSYLPLCKGCYLECMAGKVVSTILRDNLGTAIYNPETQKIDFPSCIPVSRFPKQGIKKKALLAGWKCLPSCEERSAGIALVKVFLTGTKVPLSNGTGALSQCRPCLAISNFNSTLLYVDSGAGQCLCSCDDAFINMSPCEVEISGVAGSLQIYGIGTALFVVKKLFV